ncbi:MAG: hypothetical protein ACXWIU_08660 [Limisphaerales bacterium]
MNAIIGGAPVIILCLCCFLRSVNKTQFCNIQEEHISTASCILANVSIKLGGRPLVYDHAKRHIVGDHEATKLLRRRYRSGYKHPEVT